MPLQPLQGHDRGLYPGAIGIGGNQADRQIHVAADGRARAVAAGIFGISAFALIAAAAAMYSFSEVGGVLGRITEERVPAALDSL